jgi:ERBB-3 binding protein
MSSQASFIGVAFPTCLNINNILCHYAPSTKDEEEGDSRLTTLHNGDLVKIELGVHDGGHPVLLAYSLVVGGGAEDPLIMAAHQILRVHLEEIRAGVDTLEASKKINQFVSGLDVKFFEGTWDLQLTDE